MSRLSPAILALAFATPLSGQNPAGADPEGQAVVVGETITIRSGILGEDRRVHVQLPPDYDIEPDARYAVIYQLDGDAHPDGVGLAVFLPGTSCRGDVLRDNMISPSAA